MKKAHGVDRVPMTEEEQGLYYFIRYVIDCYDDGYAAVMGRLKPPELDRPEHKGRRKNGYGTPQERAKALELAGTWERITAGANAYRLKNPQKWRLFDMANLFIRPGGSIRDGRGGYGAMIREKCGGMSDNTMSREYDRAVLGIAQEILKLK